MKATVKKVGNKVIPQAGKGSQEETRGLFVEAGFGGTGKDVNYDGDSCESESESLSNGEREKERRIGGSKVKSKKSLMNGHKNESNDFGEGNYSGQVSKADVERRIRSYLHESDENCKESATLIAIVVIGLIVTGTVIGLLKLGHSDAHLNHKGSHAQTTHTSYTLPWFEAHMEGISKDISNNTLSVTDEYGMQPLYRNYLLQQLYEMGMDYESRIVIGENMYEYISVAHGSWIPPKESNTSEELEVMEAPAIMPKFASLPVDAITGKPVFSKFGRSKEREEEKEGSRKRRLGRYVCLFYVCLFYVICNLLFNLVK